MYTLSGQYQGRQNMIPSEEYIAMNKCLIYLQKYDVFYMAAGVKSSFGKGNYSAGNQVTIYFKQRS